MSAINSQKRKSSSLKDRLVNENGCGDSKLVMTISMVHVSDFL